MADMVGDLRRRKLGKLFDIIDADRDGLVGVADYEALGQRLVEVSGGNKGAPEVAEMRETFRVIWEEFQAAADKDGDGQVTRDEFIASIVTPVVTDPGRTLRFIGLTCNLLFGIADSDRNGRISKDEHVRMGQRVFGVSEADAVTSFSKLDFWRKGFLTMDAYVVAYTEFLTSTFEAAPGNWLFGRV